MPENVMENEIKGAFKTIQKLNQSWYETYQTAAQSTFDLQGRTVQYAQCIFIDSMETLKGHMEATQHWFKTANKPQNPRESIPSLMESGIEVYKSNVMFLQRAFDQGVKAFEGNAEVIRNLTQTLVKKAQERQEMLWS